MLSQEIIERAHRAVDLAQGPAGCKYVGQDKKPQCVIAQYFYLNDPGILPTLEEWDCRGSTGGSASIEDIIRDDEAPIISGSLEAEFLTRLQMMWDAGYGGLPSPDEITERRQRMHRFVEQVASAVDLVDVENIYYNL
jgi:hypothetical protein